MRKEFKLWRFHKRNFKGFKIRGWQLSDATEEEKREARELGRLLDIYENSFWK